MRYYLISGTGAILTNDKRAMEASKKVGYWECSREEYYRKISERQREERKIIEEGKGDFWIEKGWHTSIGKIPSVDKISAFKGAFKKKKKFNLDISGR